MKKITSTLYWFGHLLLTLAAYGMLAFIFGLVLRVPDSLVGGIISFGLVLLAMVFGGDQDKTEAFKHFIDYEG